MGGRSSAGSPRLQQHSKSAAEGRAQTMGLPHKQMPESGKTKWHWTMGLPHKKPKLNDIALTRATWIFSSPSDAQLSMRYSG